MLFWETGCYTTLSFGRSPPRYGLTLCPFTLKLLSPSGVINSTAPRGDTLLTKKGHIYQHAFVNMDNQNIDASPEFT